MLETKEFKFVRNFLWPFKSTLEVSDAGINNKGNMVRWEEIQECRYGLTYINGAASYLVSYKNKEGKNTIISFVVPITGSKQKKILLEDVYDTLSTGFMEKIIQPRTEEALDKIKSGQTLTLAKCKVNSSGIEILKGLLKKEPTFIPWNQVDLDYPAESGGYLLSSDQDPKKGMMIVVQEQPGSRVLEQIVKTMINP